MAPGPKVVVVGNGLFGSAATRHLAEAGCEVMAVGASPARGGGSGPPSRNPEPHTVYSSHDDAARLTRRHDSDTRWAPVSERAVAGYRAIEERSGITFFHDVGALICSRPGGDGRKPDPMSMMDETNIDYVHFPPGDDAWRQRWPELSLPASHYVLFEDAPAGYIEPKRLIAAQNRLAEQAGAAFVTDTVIAIERRRAAHRISTAGGEELSADAVLVAAGAFCNVNGLLPEPVDIRLKSEVVALAEVAPHDAERLARYPTMKYMLDPSDIWDLYMVPPVRYDDGRHHIKLGANSRLDTWFRELGEIQEWFCSDTDPDYLPIYEPAVRSLWPDLEIVAMRTRPCIVTYTPSGVPCIEHRGEGLFVATGGNGAGAKGSDVWGEQAADLVRAALG